LRLEENCTAFFGTGPVDGGGPGVPTPTKNWL